MVELQALGFSLERDVGQGMDHEFIQLTWSKVHTGLLGDFFVTRSK